MIKVTIELYPYGDSVTKRELTSFVIANDGTGDVDFGNYIFKRKNQTAWEPSLQGWDRTQPVEKLVQAVIEKHYE